MEPPHIDVLQVSQAEWRRVYCEDPHTSFPMIDDLMFRLAISYKDLLKNPGILVQKLEGGQPLDLDYRDLARRPGRCTSFAIKVAMELEAKHPETFKFQYFHLGRSGSQSGRSGHRLARCMNTGVLIDSTSDRGVTIMEEGGDWIDSYQGRLKYFDGHSLYEGTERHDETNEPTTSEPVSPEQAMEICLREIAKRKCLVCSFRKFIDNEPVYTSMMRWNLGKKRIELSDFEQIPGQEPRTKPLYYITFDPTKGGTRLTQLECINKLVAFLTDPINGSESQWRRKGDLDRFTRRLWGAATKLGGDVNEPGWGIPVWEKA